MSLKQQMRNQHGETLLELVVAIVILGVCVVAIGGGIALSVKVSDIHRKQALAQQWLHNDAELIQDPSRYQQWTCASGSPNYAHPPVPAAALPTPPDGGTWTIVQPTISYWTGTAWTATPCVTTDAGLQQVTLELISGGGFVDEKLVVVVRSTL